MCDRMLCRACEYCRSGGVGKVRGAGGDVSIGRLVLIGFGGILFSGAFGRLVLIFMCF